MNNYLLRAEITQKSVEFTEHELRIITSFLFEFGKNTCFDKECKEIDKKIRKVLE